MRSFHLGLLFATLLAVTVNCEDETQRLNRLHSLEMQTLREMQARDDLSMEEFVRLNQRLCDLEVIPRACEARNKAIEAENNAKIAKADLTFKTFKDLLLEFGKDVPASAPFIDLSRLEEHLRKGMIAVPILHALLPDCLGMVRSCDEVLRYQNSKSGLPMFSGVFGGTHMPDRTLYYIWKGTWSETISALLIYSWHEGLSVGDAGWGLRPLIVMTKSGHSTPLHRAAVGALLKDEVPFSSIMDWLVSHVNAVRNIMTADMWVENTKLLSVFMDAAFAMDFSATMKAYKANEVFKKIHEAWYGECVLDDAYRPKCNEDLCKENSTTCDYARWKAREPKSGSDTLVGDSKYESFARMPEGWIMRRYIDGGADRVTLMLVWGTIMADKAEMEQAGEWAVKTLTRLESAKTLKMVSYFRSALGEIAKRRGGDVKKEPAVQEVQTSLDPEEVMRRMADEDRKRAKQP